MKSKFVLRRRPITGEIRKIQLFHCNGELGGVRFFNADGKLIYESARNNVFTNSVYSKHEILL